MADEAKVAELIAKEEIRELVCLYSRGVDRKDGALLRSLYTADGVDNHDVTYRGGAEGYVDFLEGAFPYMRYSGHHICNHLIAVDGDRAEGEVYALAYHVIPDGKGGSAEDFMCVRYIDQYRREDGRWLFAQRDVKYDYRSVRPIATPEGEVPKPEDDVSVTELAMRLFARGARA
ncbi:nuclear transport factor 2 family protein [Stakelama tenebrarum]|uniref:Nuclear transport factor 2 family protein n=1 Tax=Stakelama tenebrarum TaxID=2711215 RepID=A0A6G6Y863_9SPHN|nr:nuclear transport factor 2 family protein [Sphingosinithalassobacter tenebrarum]QIG80763.1 nuclear transport factor 2 family protein [Sphingosinithalassobacter tenebrarum]